MDAFAQQLVNGLTLGSLYALIAVGYTVVYGIVQLINFAHGEIFMIGAFGALSTWLIFFQGNTDLLGAALHDHRRDPRLGHHGRPMERFAYRPLRHAPRLAPLITAIGISVFLQEAVRLFYGKIPFFDFPDAKQRVPFPQIAVVTGPAFQVGGVTIQRSALFTIGCLLMCAAGLLVLRQPHQDRPRHAGRLAGPRHRPPDGHQRRPDHRGRVRRRRHARRRRRRRAGPAGHQHQLPDGLPRRPEGVHRRRPRRHRQRLGRRRRWARPSASSRRWPCSSSRAPSAAARGRTSGRSASSSWSWSSDRRASSARRWWTGHEQALASRTTSGPHEHASQGPRGSPSPAAR